MDSETLIDDLERMSPDYRKMRYYRELFKGNFSKEQTMKAHLQDLSRSAGCLGLREIQLEKLK